MIGCGTYTNIIECSQYVKDVHMIKVSMLTILMVFALIMIIYSKTKHYKRLTKDYRSFKIMFMLPLFLSYIFLALSFYFPFLLSINVNLESFMYFVYTFIVPTIAWFCLISFLVFMDWIFQRLGFENVRAFIRSAMKNNK